MKALRPVIRAHEPILLLAIPEELFLTTVLNLIHNFEEKQQIIVVRSPRSFFFQDKIAIPAALIWSLQLNGRGLPDRPVKALVLSHHLKKLLILLETGLLFFASLTFSDVVFGNHQILFHRKKEKRCSFFRKIHKIPPGDKLPAASENQSTEPYGSGEQKRIPVRNFVWVL